MSRTLTLVALAGLAACQNPSQGTFVGNPTLTAGYDGDASVAARGGSLVADAVEVAPCDGERLELGAVTIAFQGGVGTSGVQVPAGDYCGVTLRLGSLRLEWDDGRGDGALIGGPIDVVVEQEFSAAEDETVRVRLGGEGLLAEIAALAGPGEHRADEVPALAEALAQGLEESDVGPNPTPGPRPDLPGRLNIEGYPSAPDGTLSTGEGCEPSTDYHLAVPIPPASMAVAGLGEEVGWCIGPIRFPEDLAPRTATQTDYSDLSTYEVVYNGWGQSCGASHCDDVVDNKGNAVEKSCTVLAWCDGEGQFAAVGFTW